MDAETTFTAARAIKMGLAEGMIPAKKKRAEIQGAKCKDCGKSACYIENQNSNAPIGGCLTQCNRPSKKDITGSLFGATPGGWTGQQPTLLAGIDPEALEEQELRDMEEDEEQQGEEPEDGEEAGEEEEELEAAPNIIGQSRAGAYQLERLGTRRS